MHDGEEVAGRPKFLDLGEVFFLGREVGNETIVLCIQCIERELKA